MKRSVIILLGLITFLNAGVIQDVEKSSKMPVVYVVSGFIALATLIYFFKLNKDLKD